MAWPAATYSTATFTVAVGTHTITVAGLDPQGGDNTALVDNVTALVDNVSVQSNLPTQFVDPNFGAVNVGAGQWQYPPSGSPWTFTGTAGVSGNGGAIAGGNPSAPEGTQVGFVQDTGSISQTLNLSAAAYTLKFVAAQRGNYNHGGQSLQVSVDGILIGSPTTPATSNYAGFTSISFTVSTGIHEITIQGVNPQGGDNTALIDQVMLRLA